MTEQESQIDIPQEDTPVEEPKFLEWHIRELKDIATVPDWYQDKVMYYLSWALRKARVQKRQLVSFTFPERGILELEMVDLSTGETIFEPSRPIEDDIDPLS